MQADGIARQVAAAAGAHSPWSIRQAGEPIRIPQNNSSAALPDAFAPLVPSPGARGFSVRRGRGRVQQRGRRGRALLRQLWGAAAHAAVDPEWGRGVVANLRVPRAIGADARVRHHCDPATLPRPPLGSRPDGGAASCSLLCCASSLRSSHRVFSCIS